MIVALIVATVPIAGLAIVQGAFRIARTVRPVWRQSHDGALCVVVLASGWVREDALGWGSAMRAEFDSVEGRGPRWYFAVGCLRAALQPYRPHDGSSSMVAAAVVAGLVICSALAVYGRANYPAQSMGGSYLVLSILFAAGGIWMVLGGGRATRMDGGVARRYGSAGGVAVGALFVLATTPLDHAGYAAALAVGGAVAVPALATRVSGDPRAGLRAGMWIGLISGLVFFIGLMSLTYEAAGWFTHDREAVAVFNNFGPMTEHSHQLAQWPGFVAFLVRRESAVAVLFGFFAAPLIALVSGALGGVLGRRRGEVHRSHGRQLT